MGEVNFVIYSSKATQLTNWELENYLLNLGCDAAWRAYPASGQSRQGGIVAGVYIVQSSTEIIPYPLHVASYTIGGNFQEHIGYYQDGESVFITQIF